MSLVDIGKAALRIVLTVIFVYALTLWTRTKPLGVSWRCHASIHDWKRVGHKEQCRRCGERRNDLVGFDRLKMHFHQLRMSISQYKGARSHDWQTPKWLYDQLNERYGPFNLDPCTSEDNPLGTEFFITEELDGLKTNWNRFGLPVRFFMNPPYGRETKHWVKKAHKEVERYRPHMMGVGLLPVRTDPKWFHEYILPYYEIIFLPGRVAFIDPETGRPVKGTNFASMLVIYR